MRRGWGAGVAKVDPEGGPVGTTTAVWVADLLPLCLEAFLLCWCGLKTRESGWSRRKSRGGDDRPVNDDWSSRSCGMELGVETRLGFIMREELGPVCVLGSL